MIVQSFFFFVHLYKLFIYFFKIYIYFNHFIYIYIIFFYVFYFLLPLYFCIISEHMLALTLGSHRSPDTSRPAVWPCLLPAWWSRLWLEILLRSCCTALGSLGFVVWQWKARVYCNRHKNTPEAIKGVSGFSFTVIITPGLVSMKHRSYFCTGSWMRSVSRKSRKRKSCTSSSFSGPPMFSIRIPVLGFLKKKRTQWFWVERISWDEVLDSNPVQIKLNPKRRLLRNSRTLTTRGNISEFKVFSGFAFLGCVIKAK